MPLVGRPMPGMPETARSTDRCNRNITRSHKELVVTIDQVEGAVHGTADHIALKNILTGNRRLCEDSGCIELVISINNAPLTVGLLHTESR